MSLLVSDSCCRTGSPSRRTRRCSTSTIPGAGTIRAFAASGPNGTLARQTDRVFAGSAAGGRPHDVVARPPHTCGAPAREIGETRFGLPGERAVGQKLERPDVPAPDRDVEHLLVGWEASPFGATSRRRAGSWLRRSGVMRYTPRRRNPLLGAAGLVHGSGSRCSRRLHHDVVGTVQPPPLEAVRDDGNAAVELLPRHPAAVCSQAINRPWRSRVSPLARSSAAGRRSRPAGDVLHALVVVDVAESR